MLVAVRAIAPVAGNPANRAEAMLATPMPTSSCPERCRRPVIPSATVAESERLDAGEEGDHECAAEDLAGEWQD